MRILGIIFGMLFLLGGLFGLFMAFMEAGGMHGFESFRFDRLGSGDALSGVSIGGGGLVVGIVLLVLSRKKGAR